MRKYRSLVGALMFTLLATATAQLDAGQTVFKPAVHVHFTFFYPDAKLTRMCPIESTLRTNPGAVVHLHTQNATAILESYRQSPLYTFYSERVIVHQTSFEMMFKGTPLYDWYMAKRYLNSTWPTNQLSNAARLALMYKYGGVYMDLDYIVQRDLDELPINVVAFQETKPRTVSDWHVWNGHVINGAFQRFGRPQHGYLKALMENFVQEFNGNIWGAQGPGLMTRVFGRACASGSKPADWCSDLTVMPFETVYPIPWQDIGLAVAGNATGPKASRIASLSHNATAVHFWNSVWKRLKQPLHPESVLAVLFRRGCPISYSSIAASSQEGMEKQRRQQ